MFQSKTRLQMHIRMGITIFIFFIWGRKSSQIKLYGSTLTRRCKTKFLAVYPTIYLPNENFEYSNPLNGILNNDNR